VSVKIRNADLDTPEFAELMGAHADLMLRLTPPGSCHFIPLDGLRAEDVTVWEIRDGDTLVGSGALKHLDDANGELKTMHTLESRRGDGLGRKMLEHIIAEARARGYEKLSLETGSTEAFLPSRRLYAAHGFETCGPFGDYVEDPHNVFMALQL